MNDYSRHGEVRFVSNGRETCFSCPERVVSTHRLEDVWRCMAEVQADVDSGGYAAGFVTYEAASGFDPSLATHSAGELPLLCFFLYSAPPVERDAVLDAPPFMVGAWSPAVSPQAYQQAIQTIHQLIAAGDTYQVNYTFPMTAPFSGDALGWFRTLCLAQRSKYAAFMDLGRYSIVSVSPELFFRLDGENLETRPMKGTRPRGRWPEEDHFLARQLQSSEKDRAENVMIVDLLRNDMGRISAVNSVEVPSLFEVEQYETVWQMTSRITSRTNASVPEIFRSLFPSGSVTGAPKIRTMEIIRDLEPFPRGIYCGAMGWWGPGRRAAFNVAIRTAVIDRQTGSARYHVGGGITWDSTAKAEYEECCVKAAVLTQDRPDFQLIETVLFDKEYFLLDAHLERMQASADYFGFLFNAVSVRSALHALSPGPVGIPLKIRIRVNRDGQVSIEQEPVAALGPIHLALAAAPVDDRDVFLYHKTSHRRVYQEAKESRPDCSDVILWNQRGEITETAMANIALMIDGKWLTPPVCSGLLAGVMRGQLLQEGKLFEAVLRKADLERASQVAVFNSVRKWIDVASVKR